MKKICNYKKLSSLKASQKIKKISCLFNYKTVRSNTKRKLMN